MGHTDCLGDEVGKEFAVVISCEDLDVVALGSGIDPPGPPKLKLDKANIEESVANVVLVVEVEEKERVRLDKETIVLVNDYRRSRLAVTI